VNVGNQNLARVIERIGEGMAKFIVGMLTGALVTVCVFGLIQLPFGASLRIPCVLIVLIFGVISLAWLANLLYVNWDSHDPA
jgi:hypothetical protein